MLDRALAWAYLSETESSFEIEREAPSAAKAERFVQLLHHAHDGRELSEEYLVELQQSVVTNPLDQAVSYRTEQNWLRNQMRGPLGVTYVPPSPDHVDDLMEAFNQFCNHPPAQLDPLFVASIASFGFVFIHPFMDGNGRLSRFLFHHALCRSGRLAKGFLLPVSIAIKRNEVDYLATLQTFSKPARDLWHVRQAGDNDFTFQPQTNADIYRYWDATPIVEFGLRMAKEALEHDLQKETQFLGGYDRVLRMINEQFDVRNTILPTLINGCYEQEGRISKRLRKKYEHLVQPEAYDWIESCVKEVFFAKDDEG
nr:Fic family protein [Craterilacuibacter sp. RT1T]